MAEPQDSVLPVQRRLFLLRRDMGHIVACLFDSYTPSTLS